VTALHRDNYENIYCQVIGNKHFVLLPPIEAPCVNERILPCATYESHVQRESHQVSQEFWVSIPCAGMVLFQGLNKMVSSSLLLHCILWRHSFQGFNEPTFPHHCHGSSFVGRSLVFLSKPSSSMTTDWCTIACQHMG